MPIKRKVCKSDLYKSTYNGNAFDKGRVYIVSEENEEMVWLIDNENREFNFSKINKEPYYFLEDYFH